MPEESSPVVDASGGTGDTMEAHPHDQAAAVAAARVSRRALAGLQSGLTWRSVLLGVLLTAFISHWSQYAELVIHGTQISLTYPPIGAFIIFVCMYLITNVLLKAFHRPAALTSEELVIIFSMLVVAAGISSIDLAQKLIPMISGPYYYASEANRYDELFLPYIVRSLAPSDPDVVKGLYEGWAYGIPWAHWVVPLTVWTVFTLLTYVVMLCLLTLVRRQWIDGERLLFPLVAVPLEVIQEGERGRLLNAFFRSRVMWIGFALGFLVHFYNGLPGYFPGLPIIEVARIGGKVVPTSGWPHPWNEWPALRFSVLPLIIGLS
ncbi:MAG: OPT/YSL family transporter, partial [Armatimonadota bacterium]